MSVFFFRAYAEIVQTSGIAVSRDLPSLASADSGVPAGMTVWCFLACAGSNQPLATPKVWPFTTPSEEEWIKNHLKTYHYPTVISAPARKLLRMIGDDMENFFVSWWLCVRKEDTENAENWPILFSVVRNGLCDTRIEEGLQRIQALAKRGKQSAYRLVESGKP
ncbi:MAG: hypothetical protein LGR52_07890 [Candidatus Thiosymbion ectosymbiont of Robbea hypermnestra]|nr:hypothetical protein [Candidatus Thiosymbion ectosymbiont of Robbea hypermnestra]